MNGRPDKRGRGRGGRPRRPREKPEFDQRVVDLARVARVMAGGKRMSFRAAVAIGDRKGRVAVGVAKGADVAIAINKAVLRAKKQIVEPVIVEGTLPHEIVLKYKASRVMLKPARKGTGIKAGGVMRIVLELAGVQDVVGKIMGSANKANNAKATVEALKRLRAPEGYVKPKRPEPKPEQRPGRPPNRDGRRPAARRGAPKPGQAAAKAPSGAAAGKTQ